MSSSEKYQKYTPLEHILKRPDSYVGSIENNVYDSYWILSEDKKSMIQKKITIVPGFFKIFDEILVNSIDQSSQDQNVDAIKVVVNKEEKFISVFNTGNGIPIELHSKEKIYIPEMIFGELLTSENYDDSKKRTVGGRNGYGAKLANIFSLRFIIEIVDPKSGQKYIQEFSKNMTEKTKPKITKCKNAKGYVKITFYPDLEKFGMTEFTDDILSVFEKRVYDCCACTHDKVNVYYNDTKLNYKTFEKYVDLYIGNKKETSRVYDSSARWEVAVCHSNDGFKQVSFVNGIQTHLGGAHVESVVKNLIKKMIENYKGKNTIKENFVKEHLFVFVKATLENPTFSSQTKNECTSKYSSFGSRFDISEDFIKKISRLGILDDALALSKHKEQRELSKTDGKKKISIKGIPKLEDARKAGGSESANCTIIFTEGDSAKTCAISGLSIVGREYYGVFPLKGKLLNTREATSKQLVENEEINSIKQILGLQNGKEYTSPSELRYGKILILTDADVDGSHIKGLITNFIHNGWPSLCKMKLFMNAMITPILKITKRQTVISFYTLPEFEEWKRNNSISGWSVKYYKGLGTSTSNEAKEYFRNMNKNVVNYTWDSESDENMLLAFKKENADKRKLWIQDGIKRNETLNYSTQSIPFNDFINKDLILFSIADNQRSIPNVIDGLKPSQRKVIYACRKRKNTEQKVAQLSGYVSTETCYHHGEMSMHSTIISLAQDFVGSNNFNLLEPIGQFGTRLMGGKDAASPRYIFTKLSEYTQKHFNKNDDELLEYLDDDGTKIEPKYFVPTLPLILVNGADGIGTGYSCNVPCFNPEDIKKEIKNCLDKKTVNDLTPWYKNFKGKIESNNTENTVFTVKGIYEQVSANTIEITELPIGSWTQDYKEFLENNLDKFIISYVNYSTECEVRFIVKYTPEKVKDIWKDFKLMKTIRTTNMHLFDSNGEIRKYENTSEIIKEFVDVRMKFYKERKALMLKTMKRTMSILENKIRFIREVTDEEVIVFRKKKNEIVQVLKDRKYNTVDKSFDYLLDMKIHFLTFEKIQEFDKEHEKIKEEIQTLEGKTERELWEEDLS